MSYSTVIEVRNALSQHPDGSPWDDGDEPDKNNPTGTAADLPNDQIQDAIDEADSLIDAYLGALYIVPVLLDPLGNAYVPPIVPLMFWSRNLAAYNATLTYSQRQDFTDQDPIARRYNATIAYLKAVAAGQIVLPFPSNATDTAGEGAGAPINPYFGGDMFQPRDFSLTRAHQSGFPWGFGGEAYLSQLDYPWPT